MHINENWCLEPPCIFVEVPLNMCACKEVFYLRVEYQGHWHFVIFILLYYYYCCILTKVPWKNYSHAINMYTSQIRPLWEGGKKKAIVERRSVNRGLPQVK